MHVEHMNVEQISYKEYNDREGFRSSHIKHLMKSPAHYLACLDENKKTDALLFGRAFHAAILEPDVFSTMKRMWPAGDGRTKAVAAARAEFEAILEPQHIVVKEEWTEQLEGMLTSVWNNKILKRMLKNAVQEVSYFAPDPETGIVQKYRWDSIETDHAIPLDFKTIQDASEKSIESAIYDKYDGYFLNAGHYSAGAEQNGKIRSDVMMLVFIEKTRPWGIKIKTLEHYTLDAGKFRRQQALRTLRKAIDTKYYPCYQEDAVVSVPPVWFENQMKDML